ncbi:sugar transferase [Microbacterium sp. 22242]|uniref:sugar transferase n=1 Tax=Microbacterium sp. 22242 TaxID=3453896 RepID=UPI003F845D8D
MYLTLRGVIDRVIAAVALVVLSPVLVALTIAVLVRMGRPVLFRQKRVGQGGREFFIYKFRTMVQDAEQRGGGYMPAEMNLIPPLGAFLRKTSLDELPQLLNILKGDISIVGPRPALPSQYARYTSRQAGRVSVPQGLTGLAQVLHRNEAPWSVRIETDLRYIDRIGPGTDFRILCATAVRVLRGTGVRTDQTAGEVDDLGPARTNGEQVAE